MSGPSEVKIRVLWQDTEAKRGIVDFARQSTAANKAVAMEARVAATATLSQALAIETLERAALSASRAQLASAQASTNLSRASKITADSLSLEAAAATKATVALERKAAVQARVADRALVFADTRQHRDLSYLARDQEDVKDRRVQMVSKVADGAMLAGGGALAGLAYAGTQAAKFETILNHMRANTVMTGQEFDAFKKHILEMGRSTGASMEEMSLAFMRAKNHGLDMKESMAVVDAATKSALATGSDIQETANVLAQTMHIFHLGADQTDAAMETLHQASLQGNVAMTELVQNFGLVEAVTSKYGLTLQDTAAVFSALTENGLNAAEAGTQVRDMMQHLTNPGKAAREEIEKLSKATGVDLVGDIKKLQAGTGSLSQTMVDLSKATGGHAVEVNKIIPAQRGAFGAMALTGKASEDLEKGLDKLTATMGGKLHPVQDAFAREQASAKGSLDRLNGSLETLYIKLGTSVLPILERGADAVFRVTEGFNKLDPETQKNVVSAIAAGGAFLFVAGGAMKAVTTVLEFTNALKLAQIGFGALGVAEGGAATAGLAAFGPGAAVVVAIAALGVEIIALKNDWDDVRAAQDQAANSALAYADKLKTLKAGTNRDALIATKQDLGRESGDLQSAIKQADQIKPRAGQNAEDMKIVRDASLRSQLGDAGYDTANDSYRTMAGAQSRLNALLPDLAKVTSALHAQTPAVNAANRMADTHADQLAPYQVPLLKAVGEFHNASVQCGEFIRKGASAFGMVGSIQSAANAALKGKNVVGSDGVDVHGAPRYPNGTVIYFGHQGAQHFVSTYVNDRGEQKVVENTEAGQGRGTWRVRADRNLSAIAAEYHGQQVAFHLPGVTGPTAGAAKPSINPYAGDTFGGGASDKAAAAALVQRAGLAADDAKRAYEQAVKAFEDTKSVHYLAAAEALRHTLAAREIAEAKADMAKADGAKDPDAAANGVGFERRRRDIEASAQKDIQALREKAGGTADDHRKAAADLAVNVLKGNLQAADQAVSRLEALAAVSTDPKNADALLAGYKAQAGAQLALLRETLKRSLADVPNVPGRQTERQAMVSSEQTEEMRVMSGLGDKTAEVDARRIESKQRLLSLQTEQAAAARAEEDAVLAAAQTEDARRPLREEIHRMTLKQLDATRQIALLDNETKFKPLLDRAAPVARPGIQAQSAAAARSINEDYGTAVGTENVSFGAQERDAANAAITTRADRLRTEAGLTDDLTAKMAKLAQAYDLMIGVEPDPAAAGLLRRQKQDEQDKLGLRRDSEAAQRSLSAGMMDNNPAVITGALDALKDLTTDARANRDEQASARTEYGTAIRDLTEQMKLSPHEAISRLNDERPNMTAGELASATAAAKAILAGMLNKSFSAIDDLHSPRDRKNALDTLKSSVETDPVYKAAGVADDAGKKIDAKLKESLKRSGIVDEFMGELSAGAGRASSGVVKSLLNPKDRKNIGKAFWLDIANAAEGALGNVVQKEVTHGLDGLLGAGTDALGGLLGGHRKSVPGADAGHAKGAGASTTGGMPGTITGYLGPLGSLLGHKTGKDGAQSVDTMHVANLVVAGTEGKTGVPGTKPGSAASGVGDMLSTGMGIASLLAGPLGGAGLVAKVAGASGIFGSIGKIFGFSEGGVVPGPRGAGDIVPAMLSPEEWVIPAAKVRAMREADTRIGAAPVAGQGGGQTVNYEAHYHQPVFHSAEDVDRENRRNAQRLTTAFTVG